MPLILPAAVVLQLSILCICNDTSNILYYPSLLYEQWHKDNNTAIILSTFAVHVFFLRYQEETCSYRVNSGICNITTHVQCMYTYANTILYELHYSFGFKLLDVAEECNPPTDPVVW